MTEQIHTDFVALYDTHADAVFRLCYAKTSSREEAKDLTQEAFTRVFERMQSPKTRIENGSAFLFTVTRNLIKDHYKKKKAVVESDLPEGTFEAVGVSADAEIHAEARGALRALSQVSEPYRTTLSLHLVEGYPIQEVAELLGEKPNTISVRVKRGLTKLRALYTSPAP